MDKFSYCGTGRWRTACVDTTTMVSESSRYLHFLSP